MVNLILWILRANLLSIDGCGVKFLQMRVLNLKEVEIYLRLVLIYQWFRKFYSSCEGFIIRILFLKAQIIKENWKWSLREDLKIKLCFQKKSFRHFAYLESPHHHLSKGTSLHILSWTYYHCTQDRFKLISLDKF